MSTHELQKYLWTATGMRPTKSEFGAMTYYREADVWSLVNRLTREQRELCGECDPAFKCWGGTRCIRLEPK